MDSHSTPVRDSSHYGEEFRPAFHFTPAKNWINDPNGLLFHNGRYHLFYQHNPQGNLWGNMSWGHSVSTDLFHWEHLPVAIACDETFGIFSGSAVMDYKNTSGFGSIDNPAMVTIYTAHRHDGTHQSQHIAYSLDEGLTWTKYANNPVLDLSMKDFRDPKVSWDEATSTWLMAIAKPEEHKIAFFRSPDLKSWQHLSDFGPQGATGGCWECPDLFPLTDEDGLTKWVLLVSLNPGGIAGGSGTQYFIGQWDGTSFTPDHQDSHWIDYGRDNYAGVTFNNTGDRRIFIGWMSNWQYANEIPTHIWRGSMTIPRELTLKKEKNFHLLNLISIDEFSHLKHQEQQQSEITTPSVIKIKSNSVKPFTFSLTDINHRCIKFGFNQINSNIYLDRSNAFLESYKEELQVIPDVVGEVELEVICDIGSIEITLLNQVGRITALHLLEPGELKLELSNGDAEIVSTYKLFTSASK